MNNQQLVDATMALRKEPGATAAETQVTNQAVLQHLLRTPQLTTYLLARQPDLADLEHANLVTLVKRINNTFNEGELQTLCFELNLPYAELDGRQKGEKARELVLAMQRRRRLPDLLAALRQERPRSNWGPPPERSGAYDIISTLDIAVVVDIARPTVRDVARYLDEKEVTANIILLEHTQAGQFLSATSPWDEFVRGFAQIMNAVKHMFSGARPHFFLSAPGALLFGLGAIWGTVDEAHIYHYEKGTYYPVIHLSRSLR